MMNTRSEPHLEEKRHTSEVDVNFKDHNDDTPLLLACKKGDIELVKKLIEEKADLNYYNDIKEYDAAVLAYQHKHFDVLALLLSKGYNNIYIFFEVFQENDISMMLKLVDYGYIGEAHLHCLDREKNGEFLSTIFSRALKNNNVSLIKTILESELYAERCSSIFRTALKNQDIPVILKLVADGYVELKDYFRGNDSQILNTILIDAIARKDAMVVREVLNLPSFAAYKQSIKITNAHLLFSEKYPEIKKIFLTLYFSQFEQFKIPDEKLIGHLSLVENRVELLGVGASARVFEAKFEGKPVAVKMPLWGGNGKILESPDFLTNTDFTKEVMALDELRSPHIIEFLGVVNHHFIPGIVLKLYDCSLRDILKKQKSISLEQQLTWAKEISEGLTHIHKKGWIHNDLRGNNIFLDEKQHAYIGDFGEACKETSPEVNIFHKMDYFPFEALDQYGRIVSPTRYCDIYSFGFLLWEMATGKTPYNNLESHQIFNLKKNHQQEKIPDDCPSILRELITDCWNDDPLKRPTAVELSYRLEKALEDLQKTKKEEVQPVSVIPLSMFQTPGVIQSEHVDNSPRPR